MNAIAPNSESRVASNPIGWHPNLERLRHEADLARAGHTVDPWSIVEAECWLDLIEAELTSPSTRGNPKARAQLVVWRTEISRLRTQLKALASSAPQVSDNRSERSGSMNSLGSWTWQDRVAAATQHQPVYGGRINEISSAA